MKIRDIKTGVVYAAVVGARACSGKSRHRDKVRVVDTAHHWLTASGQYERAPDAVARAGHGQAMLAVYIGGPRDGEQCLVYPGAVDAPWEEWTKVRERAIAAERAHNQELRAAQQARDALATRVRDLIGGRGHVRSWYSTNLVELDVAALTALCDLAETGSLALGNALTARVIEDATRRVS